MMADWLVVQVKKNLFFSGNLTPKNGRSYQPVRLVLVKCQDNKMVKSPYNCFIFPLNQPQVANQQQKKIQPSPPKMSKNYCNRDYLCFATKIMGIA